METREYNTKKKLALLAYSIYLILAFSLIFNLKINDYSLWIIKFSYILISHIFITLSCFRYLDIQTMSLSNIFLILLYIFHLGQVLIKGLNRKYDYYFDVSTIVSQDAYIKSVIFSLLAISILAIGIIIGCKNRSEYKDIVVDNRSIYNTTIKVGCIILLITLPIEIYYTILKLLTSSSGGYLDVLEVESSGILSQFAKFHLIGVSLLIMGYSDDKKKCNYIYYIYMAYSLISMLSGSRIYKIISIIVVTYVLFKSTNKKISIKLTSLVFIVAFFGLVILNTIADMRNMKISDIDQIIELFKLKLINNPIFDSLEEFGATIYTVCITISKVPFKIAFSQGNQFIEGFATLLPNINGIFTDMNYNSNFVNLLDVEAIGGSYVAELYYSFGYSGIILSLIVGFILIKVDQKFDYLIHNKKYIKASYFIMLIFSSILWIRGAYIGILRNSIWGIALIYFISKIAIKNELIEKYTDSKLI